MTLNKQSCLKGLASLLLIAAGVLYGHTGYLYCKAVLAQWLIADAWQQSLQQQDSVRPWPWADTWPVARLQFQNSDNQEDLYILEGATGSSLAFGPGHMRGTALPGTNGYSIVGGHRDTHFRFLQQLKTGDHIRVQNRQGEWKYFTVDKIQIRDINHGPLLLNPEIEGLQLVTCYPFNTLATGGPLRYLVSLKPAADSAGPLSGS